MTPPPDFPYEEKEWAKRIRQGDAAAFEQLFRRYFDALCAFAWRYVHAPDVAEDLVQDVFVRIWQRREDWTPRHTAKAYLYGAVRNEALKHLEHQDVVRRRQEEERHQAPPPPSVREPDEELTFKELKAAVQGVIEKLPERRRHIFVLHRQHGLTYREIAALLSISPATVETQVGRALEALRKLLSTLPLLLL